MPDLILANVSNELYRQLEVLAAADQVAVADEALRLLSEAVQDKAPKNGVQAAIRSQADILDDIARHRFAPLAGMPGVVDMLREDRQR